MLIKTGFFEFLRRNILPIALPILKYKIITTNQAVNVIDDDILHDLARCFVPAIDFLINELTRIFAAVLVIVSRTFAVVIVTMTFIFSVEEILRVRI